MARVFIGVGSNIDPEGNIPAALRQLGMMMRIARISQFYRTKPLGNCQQADFYNGVVEASTMLDPVSLKERILRHIEAILGRIRTVEKNAPRTIDLDLLLYDNLVVTSNRLTLPDPLIVHRAFLAIPLAELAPDFLLPGTGRTLRHIAEGLADTQMVPLGAFTRQLRREILHEYRPD